nr:hypothetical protein [Kibdelosporangium sp. MJ126-NF4]CTQ96518.1 hypothetical protein [Kibdelosporangium sp. MJ126-NF4]
MRSARRFGGRLPWLRNPQSGHHDGDDGDNGGNNPCTSVHDSPQRSGDHMITTPESSVFPEGATRGHLPRLVPFSVDTASPWPFQTKQHCAIRISARGPLASTVRLGTCRRQVPGGWDESSDQQAYRDQGIHRGAHRRRGRKSGCRGGHERVLVGRHFGFRSDMADDVPNRHQTADVRALRGAHRAQHGDSPGDLSRFLRGGRQGHDGCDDRRWDR